MRLNRHQADVLRFMIEVRGHAHQVTPEIPPPGIRDLAIQCIEEEARETCDAIKACISGDPVDNMVEVADGIADLIYVAYQAANFFGIDMQAIWEEVQKTNMAKKGGPISETGKQLKPAGWVAPDFRPIIEAQIGGA